MWALLLTGVIVGKVLHHHAQFPHRECGCDKHLLHNSLRALRAPMEGRLGGGGRRKGSAVQ